MRREFHFYCVKSAFHANQLGQSAAGPRAIKLLHRQQFACSRSRWQQIEVKNSSYACSTMNKVLNPDELFNEQARLADLETPADRFHDLILAVFQSNVREAYQQYLKRPDREPDTGHIQNAAAWIQELLMPDVTQRDIAQSISRWIVNEAAKNQPQQNIAALNTEAKQSSFLPLM